MHILISAVSSARQPSGICRHAANLATSLSEEPAISRVTLLVGQWQLDYFRSAFGLDGNAVNVSAVDVQNNSCARNWWYYRQLPEIARQYHADVVHLTFPTPVRRRQFLCPVVCSLHDLYPYDSPRNFGYVRVFFNRIFLRQCLRASDAIICSSDFTLDRLRKYAPVVASRRATRIYQSIRLNPDRARVPEEATLARSPFLLTVAQHRQNKNLQLLLSAFAELRRRQDPKEQLRLVIVGAEGPETCHLRSLVQRLSLQDDVQFEAALTDAQLCQLYQECELMIVPSSIEGFCLPVAEALRCGSRVLCSDIPVLREVGGSSCRYFNLQQEQPASALADAIEAALLTPPAVPIKLDRFSAREIARQYVALYSGLAAGEGVLASPQLADLNAVQCDRYAS